MAVRISVKGLLVITLLVVLVAGTPKCNDVPGCSCTHNNQFQCICSPTNRLTELPDGIQIPQKITSLLFLNCQFTSIERVEYPLVESLQILNSDTLTNIADNAFSNMQRLTHLDLSESNLDNLTKNMFAGLHSLKILKATDCGFKTIASNAFENLPSLEHLDLSLNIGLDLPDEVFSTNANLQKVEVRRCGFKDIPEAIRKVQSLTELDIDSNSLEVLKPNALSPMKQLNMIGLDNCALKRIHETAFDGLTKLTLLNLGNNLIRHISPRHFHSFRDQLRDLWLGDNLLETLAEDILNWEQMQTISLAQNPWTCDCRLRWMTGLQNKHEAIDNATCARPRQYVGKSLYNVTSHMSCTLMSGSKSAVALAVAIPVIIICCLLIGYFAYQIYKNRTKGRRKSVRYSAVYRDTVESAKARPLPDM